MSELRAHRTPPGERDPVLALGLTCVLSGLAFLPAFASAEVSRTALTLTPWLLWAGWPCAPAGGFIRRTLPAAGLAVPLAVLGFELDRVSGWSTPALLHTALLATTLGLGSAAASAAASSARGRRSNGGPSAGPYAFAWFVAFLLLPVFVLATRPADPEGWWRWIGSASPVAWCLTRVPRGTAGPHGTGDVVSLALVLSLWLLAALPSLTSRSEREP